MKDLAHLSNTELIELQKQTEIDISVAKTQQVAIKILNIWVG